MNRFITEGKNCFRISITSPASKIITKSVGYKKIGKEKGFQKALKVRDKLGRTLWREHWDRVLNEPKLLISLPETNEPILMTEQDGYGNPTLIYRAMWSEVQDGKPVRRCMKRSIACHGFDNAYAQCKNAIDKAHQPYIELISFIKAQGSNRFEAYVID